MYVVVEIFTDTDPHEISEVFGPFFNEGHADEWTQARRDQCEGSGEERSWHITTVSNYDPRVPVIH